MSVTHTTSTARAHGGGFLGIVMLDTRFPRPLGDVGNPLTWAVPTERRIVRGVWPDKVVQSAAGLRAGRVVPAFVGIVKQLERDGARAITTSCGFLVLLQKELQAAVRVPLVSSSLCLLGGVLRREPRVGVLTIDSGKLGAEHLRAAGVPRERLKDVVVQGVDPAGEFARRILGNEETLDLEQARQDVVRAAQRLRERAPDLTTVVLECTNMPPYREAVREATGLTPLWLADCAGLFKPFDGRSVAEQGNSGEAAPVGAGDPG